MERYGYGPVEMDGHIWTDAMSYLCAHKQEENKMPIFGQ